MAADVERLSLLERKADTLEELVSLKDRRIEEEVAYRERYEELLEETKKAYSPTLWQKIPAWVWVLGGVGLGVWAAK